MKLKHNIKLLEYNEHYQVKDMKLKHNIKLLEYNEHYQVKQSETCD